MTATAEGAQGQSQDLNSMLQQHMEEAVRPVLDDLQERISAAVRQQMERREQSGSQQGTQSESAEKPSQASDQQQQQRNAEQMSTQSQQGQESQQAQASSQEESQGQDQGSIGSAITGGVSSAMQSITDAIHWLGEQIRAAIKAVVSGILKLGIDFAVSGVQPTITSMLESVKQWIKQLFSSLGERLGISGQSRQGQQKAA